MKKLLFIVVLAALASQLSFADSVNLHRFQFSDTLETLRIEDALGADSELAQRGFLFRFSYDYVQDPYFGNDNGRNVYPTVMRDIHSYMLGFGTMVTKRFFVSANLAMHKTELYTANESETDLGDFTVQAKWRITGDNAGVNVALIPFIALPTGEASEFTSNDSVGYGIKIAADKAIGKFKFFLNAGYQGASDALYAAQNIDRTNVATSAFGIFYKATDWLGFNAEYNRDLNLDGGNFRNVQGVDLSARITTGTTHWFVGSGIESARGFEQQDFNIYAGVKVGFGKACGKSCSKKKACKKSCAKACCKKPAKKVNTVKTLTQALSVERNIQFKTGSSVIKSTSYADLDSAASVIVKYQDQIGTITVEGHTDSSGRAVNNKRLSQKRADSVKAYLVSKGVKADKISSIGYGEENLKVNPESSAADRAANRRVEFKVEGMVKK